MKKDRKNIIKGSILVTVFLVSFVAGLVIMANLEEPVIKHQVEQEKKKWTPVAGPSPAGFAGAGTTGIVGIYIREHWANGSYDSNITNYKDPWAYEGTQYNKTLGGNVLANTAFDIIVTVRIVHEDIVNGTVFQLAGPTTGYGSYTAPTDWVRMNLTCPQTTPAIGALTAGGRRNITDQSLGDPIDCYINYFWNGSAGGGAVGAGYQIGNGVNANATQMLLEIYA